MKLLIRVSELMNERTNHLGSMESRHIRIPFELRKRSGLKEDEFVNLRTKTGKIATLKVSMAYGDDALNDPLSAYVSKEIFDVLCLEYIKKYEQDIEVVNNITLGCDPEFFLVNRDDAQIIPAFRLFKKLGQVGHDGVMMEIRPLPSADEFVVANNIYNLIKKAREKINNDRRVDGNKVNMIAASYYNGLAAGFHLHFGLPHRILGRNRGVKNDFQKQIVRALDYYVGVPAVMPEGKEDHLRRTSQHVIYGKPGERRVDNRTLEYRVPGGSLMRHPILTVGILGLGAIVIEDVVSRMKVDTGSFSDLSAVSDIKGLKKIYPNIPDILELIKIVCSKDLTLARRHIDIITDDVSQMLGFNKRRTSIEQFFKCIHNGTKFDSNIENNWNSYYNREVFVK